MASATAEGLKKLLPDQRYFLLSRSSYAGDHRFTTIWMGDNTSWWEHMTTHIRMMLSLNLGGFFFTGADVGGFCGDSSPDLVARWTQLGAFTPLFRNHSTKGSRDQEPYAFDEATTEICRDAIQFRYALLPYYYSEFLAARKALSPFISPLLLSYSGDRVAEIEDQFMCGRNLMVAPVVTPNARGRYVHLPEHRWLEWRMRRWDERPLKVREPGDYFVAADRDEIPIYLRENSLLPLCPPASCTDKLSLRELTVLGFVTGSAIFKLSWDDGNSWHTEESEIAHLELNATIRDGVLHASATARAGSCFALDTVRVHFEVVDSAGKVWRSTVSVNAQ
jgi:alpha-glucosidase